MRGISFFISGFAAHAAIIYMLVGLSGWGWFFFACSTFSLLGTFTPSKPKPKEGE